MSENVPTYYPPSRDFYGPPTPRAPHVEHQDDFTSLMRVQDGPGPIVALTGPGSVVDPAALPPGLLPGINADDVISEHEYLYGEVPPTVAPRASSQAGLASLRPMLDRIGPGAGEMVERELARAKAFEVIALAAVAYVDSEIDDDEMHSWNALVEAVRENRAAVQP